MDSAFLDTCVLLKPYLCDTLLSIAEAGGVPPAVVCDGDGRTGT